MKFSEKWSALRIQPGFPYVPGIAKHSTLNYFTWELNYHRRLFLCVSMGTTLPDKNTQILTTAMSNLHLNTTKILKGKRSGARNERFIKIAPRLGRRAGWVLICPYLATCYVISSQPSKRFGKNQDIIQGSRTVIPRVIFFVISGHIVSSGGGGVNNSPIRPYYATYENILGGKVLSNIHTDLS